LLCFCTDVDERVARVSIFSPWPFAEDLQTYGQFVAAATELTVATTDFGKLERSALRPFRQGKTTGSLHEKLILQRETTYAPSAKIVDAIGYDWYPREHKY
jgi:hypothetical protein